MMKNLFAIMLRDQKAKVADEMAQRDAEIVELRNQMAQGDAEIAELKDQNAQRYAEIAELRDQMAQKDVEIAELRDQMLQMKNANEERMLQMEGSLAEVLQNQPSEHQVGSTD
jgi:chromosome segregation ATPase